MKKILKVIFVMSAVFAFEQAQADVIFTGKKLGRSVNFLFEDFSCEKQIILYSENYEGSDDGVGSTTFTIMDEKFNELKTFTTPIYQPVTAEYSRASVIQGPLDINVESSDEYLWYEGITKNAFIEKCAEEGATRQEMRDGELWCTWEDPGKYYYYDIYKFQYPEDAYVWRDGASFHKYIRYSYQDWGPTGIYGEPSTVTDSRAPGVCDFYPYDSSCSDNHDICLTQTLFNNDANYEWLVSVYEAIDCSYANAYEKVEGKRICCTGFRVESENGTTVTEFKMPAGYYCRFGFPDLFLMGNKNYFLIEIADFDNSEEYTAVYEIDPQNASVKMIGAPIKVNVNPTLTNRGMTVNVDLGTPAEEGCKVVVTSINGKTVMSQLIQPGTMGTTIDTSRFERGMYIVTVADGKTTKEHTKIIIR